MYGRCYHDGHEVVHEYDVVFLRICLGRLDRLQPVLGSVHLLRTILLEQRLQHLAVGSHIYNHSTEISFQ